MNKMTKKPSLIAVDWGTSNFRAFLLDDVGNILETRMAKQGLLHVVNRQFEEALIAQIGDCLKEQPDMPVVMSGMVGSRQGWQEVPYLLCPIALNELASGLQSIEGQHNIWIIPGLCINYPDGRIDVMRGEETQILGSSQRIPTVQESGLFCLPGTHTKWVWVESGKVVRFNTFMAGEVFSLLFKHSILGKPSEQTELHVDAFFRGMEWSKRPEHLLSQLFQVRTQMLAGNLAPEDINSFLSGLLLGHEMSAILTEGINNQCIQIIANPRVAQRYEIAFKKYQLASIVLPVEQTTVRGIFKIAHQAGLI